MRQQLAAFRLTGQLFSGLLKDACC